VVGDSDGELVGSLVEGDRVGAVVGAFDGDTVGIEGPLVGKKVLEGLDVGANDGESDGMLVGSSDAVIEGMFVGDSDRASVGFKDGSSDEMVVGENDGNVSVGS